MPPPTDSGRGRAVDAIGAAALAAGAGEALVELEPEPVEELAAGRQVGDGQVEEKQSGHHRLLGRGCRCKDRRANPD